MKIEKLFPAYKDYLWGGDQLKTLFGKQTTLTPCAESWELSFHPDGLTLLSDGTPLMQAVTKEDLGENASAFPFFPMLIKFIDAKQDLSVQVHPSDAYALANENSYGKTEMWYIVKADEGAGIYLGFSRDVTKEEYRAAIESNTLTELLNFYPVKAGECYFIPAGTIHAIGKGCLICEIQQNSNLTYRVYDYGRRDKNGNLRELHIEKALKVTDLRKYEYVPRASQTLGMSKYFHVTKIHNKGKLNVVPSGHSFQALTCLVGTGTINEMPISGGDSFFIPANHGEYHLEGDLEILITEVRKYYIGIDLGGTFIKGGIVGGELLVSDQVPTESDKGAEQVVKNIASLCHSLLKKANLNTDDITGIGIGVPGMIDSDSGVVIYANNLGWWNFSIAKELEELMGIPVKIANDANVAALGEARFGCGKDYQTTVMLTLGTGVGGGIVLDGKLFEGNRSAGAELGHSVIVAGGEPCTCGRKGCLEAYASATALIRDTKRAMAADPNSKMWEIGSLDRVDGKTAFAYSKTDESAKRVVENYIEKLGTGITNLGNALRPEAVILGGGVCKEGDALIIPLQEFVDREIYAGTTGPQVKIIRAVLENKAGILGAAALWM